MDTTTTRAWLLLLCLTTIFLPSAHAGWLSDLKDSSKQALNKLLKDDEKPTIPLTPLTAADVADYPAHYRFNRVIETIHQSPLFFLETGDKSKPALVLVHGLGEAASKDWLQVIPALEKDYHVFALDLPGFGLSKGVYFEYSPAQYSETLNWFIDQHVSKGSADKPIVIGHSMGGAVSLYFAATFGHQLKKLILVDAAGILERTTFIKHLSEIKLDKEWMSDSSRRLAARAENMSQRWMEFSGSWYDPTTIVSRSKTLRKMTLSTNGNAALALTQTDFSLLDYSKIVPTQIIWGADDPIAPMRTGQVLQQILPNAQLQMIEDAGHAPMRSKPLLFNALLLDAIATAPAAKNKQDLVKSTTITKRVGSCKHDDQSYFSGYYARLDLDNCKLVVLDNVVAEQFSARYSLVNIYNSILGHKDTLMPVVRTAITATASTFNGTIESDRSRFDFAAVNLHSNRNSFAAKSSSLIIFSLSTVDSATYRGSAHGFYETEKGILDQRLITPLQQE